MDNESHRIIALHASCFLIFVTVIFLVLNTPITTTQASDLLTYENSTLGIKIDYPSNWTKEEDQNKVIFQPPVDDVSLRIEVNNFSQFIKNRDYYYTSGTEFALSPVMVGNNPALKIVYSLPVERGCTPSTRSVKVMDHYIVDGEKLFFISYSASTYSNSEEYETTIYDRYLPVVQKMIDSFEIVQYSKPTAANMTDTNPNSDILSSGQLHGSIKNIAEVQYDC